MRIDKIIEFLETDVVSVTFSPYGLKYLSLKGKKGDQLIDLNKINLGKATNPMICLLIRETLNFLETGNHNMKLDLSDFTSFQQSVFEEIGKIKVGSISTYKELAINLGNPGAARAVGSAVTKNPVSYFIPSHRVIPQRGIGICKSGGGFLRDKLLELEGHDIEKLRGNYICTRKKCCIYWLYEIKILFIGNWI